ncbi:hypothetical protein MJL33_31055, partial [Salmonella enterica subsp. enterica serovar Kentucky]|nr:hypothetical protein [Salmonella enterica subsp. enterica serovar Kentucky]
DLTASQNLTLEYGIARLDGDGSKTAGDNGLTGGYSQFFGLKHKLAFDTTTTATLRAYTNSREFVDNYPFVPWHYQILQKVFESIR